MGKHRKPEPDEEDSPPRTMERDSAPVQGLEYFGVDTRIRGDLFDEEETE